MFNPVAESIGKVLEPGAAELREFGVKLLEALRGITAEQRRTNTLLEELLIVNSPRPDTPRVIKTPRKQV